MVKLLMQLVLLLIELVTVIIILGIIAIVAMPRLVSLSQDAHDSVAHNVFASFSTSVSLYHSCWAASGANGYQVDLTCFGAGDVDSTTTGYPLGIDTNNSASGTKLQGDYCKQVWQGLLDNNDYKLVMHSNAAFEGNNDIVYWYYDGDLADKDTHCYYNYIVDDRSKGAENWQLKYYPATGKTQVGRSVLSIQPDP
ncbi:pilus assembly protein PilD [Shewanella sp. 10N.286.54.B9]|uniref:pilus assembly protein PilD n=1 Tax=Shewanella sp. 10N.286.54.B9 TaxID=3229719 RepID=UPI0035542D10